MRNILLQISYDGTNYSGWQKQNHVSTIQEQIETALKRITCQQIALHSAGRTDAGVHADAMTANFKFNSRLSTNDIQRALNAILEDDIRINCAKEVHIDFHARFYAKAKEYHYSMYTGAVMPPNKRLYMLHQSKSFDSKLVQECLEMLVGTHDFSSFENTGTRDKTRTGGKGAVRTLNTAQYIERTEEIKQFIFVGEGFLRNMVRNMVGSLLEVGRGKESPEWFHKTLKAKDRNKAGPTAPAHGLKLFKVMY
ncbi:MAG: tRNA pseudouridine(38-40) synthase TruA [Desulfotalea sp.]